MDKTVICTVGLSNSGKSTWAKAEKRHMAEWGISCRIICRDDIHRSIHGKRYDSYYNNEVSQREVEEVVWHFCHGVDAAIISACHHKRKYRDRWYRICAQYGWELQFKIFDTPVEECIRRAEAKGDDYIIPVILKQAAEFEPLTKEELS
jgi:predicted kinase